MSLAARRRAAKRAPVSASSMVGLGFPNGPIEDRMSEACTRAGMGMNRG